MSRNRSRLLLVALAAGEIAAVLLLARNPALRRFGPPVHGTLAWARTASSEDLYGGAARALAAALSAWLVVATLLSGCRRAVPALRTRRGLDALTPAALRRLLDRAVVVGLGASMSVATIRPAAAVSRVDRPVVRGPVPALTAPARSTARSSGRAPDAATRPDTPVVRGGRAAPPAPGAPSDPAVPAPPVTNPASVVVRPGDNLWVIARRALLAREPAATDLAVARYWRTVVAANAASLRSGDPNLIFPGEHIVLPAPIG